MLKNSPVEFASFDLAIEALPEWLQCRSSVREESRFKHDAKEIGRMIRERREKAEMSLRSMAKWMSISPTYLSDMERGLRPWPLPRLQDATNVLDMAERTA